MADQASGSKRRHQDMMRLMMSDYEVHIPNEDLMHDFYVKFHGPDETPYHGGVWKVHVTLPQDYPFKSPSIGFKNRLFHPNVDDLSGSVCLDVINQTWSPMYNLLNIFEVFLPQLLRYPNPTDPLNGEAASLMMRDIDGYNRKIQEYVRLYASEAIELEEQATPSKKRPASEDITGTSPGSVLQFGTLATTTTQDRSAEGRGNSAADDVEGNNDDDDASDVSEMSDIDM